MMQLWLNTICRRIAADSSMSCAKKRWRRLDIHCFCASEGAGGEYQPARVHGLAKLAILQSQASSPCVVHEHGCPGSLKLAVRCSCCCARCLLLAASKYKPSLGHL